MLSLDVVTQIENLQIPPKNRISGDGIKTGVPFKLVLAASRFPQNRKFTCRMPKKFTPLPLLVSTFRGNLWAPNRGPSWCPLIGSQ